MRGRLQAGRATTTDSDAEDEPRRPVDPQQGFRRRFSWCVRVRDRLVRRRTRAHLVSGIGSQMAVPAPAREAA